MSKQQLEWDALSAIATFFAAFVALGLGVWPIWREKNHRKSLARNLRSRLLIQLMLLRPSIARRFQNTEIGLLTSAPFTGLEAEKIAAFKSLMEQAHILEAEEHDLLIAIAANIVPCLEIPMIEAEQARNILKVVDQAMDRMQQEKFLQGKHPKLPWS